MSVFNRSLAITLCVQILTACTPVSPKTSLGPNNDAWLASHILSFDSMDSLQPEAEIICVYYRNLGSTIEVRIDFLELLPNSQVDFLLLMSHLKLNRFGFQKELSTDDWEVMIRGRDLLHWDMVTSDGYQIQGGIQKVVVDMDLDYLVITLNSNAISSRKDLLLKTITIGSDTQLLYDETDWLYVRGIPDDRQARVLLVFKDTLNANTPRQLIRQWDGAHSGPFGQRHGLRYLLLAVSKTEIPIVLLDLNTPMNLLSLELLGQLQWVINLENRGLILLPDVAFGDPEASEISLQYSRLNGLKHGMKMSKFASIQKSSFPQDDYSYYFVNETLKEGDSLSTNETLSYNLEALIDISGLTFKAKQLLILAAIDGSQSTYLVMGGSVRNTAWADAKVSGTIFEYLKSHPWINVLDAHELGLSVKSSSRYLQVWKSSKNAGEKDQSQNDGYSYWEKYSILQSNPARDLIWSNYLALTTDTQELTEEVFKRLESSNGYWMKIAEWAASPSVQSECFNDYASDLTPMCVLSSKSSILLINSSTASIEYSIGINQLHGKNDSNPSNPFKVIFFQHPFFSAKTPRNDENSGINGIDLESGGKAHFLIKNDKNTIQLERVGDGCRIDYKLQGERVEIGISNCPKMDLIIEKIPVLGYVGDFPDLSNINSTTDRNLANSLLCPTISITGTEWEVEGIEAIKGLLREPENPDMDYPPLFFLPYGTTVYQLMESKSITIGYSMTSCS